MKTRLKKLQLHRETLRNLGATQLRVANGGTVYNVSEFETQCPGLCQTGNGICGPVNTGPFMGGGCPSYSDCAGHCTFASCDC